MASVINTNISSLTAQRNLSMSQTALSTSMQRLSSGLRINSAKDDAAGLAISERFTTQVRGLNQAARNANDGISLSQTAEGALGEMTSNLQRIRELAVQSANSTNSASDRAALDLEVQQRLAEIDRVATQSSFNGVKILDGSFGDANFQVGANVGDTIGLSLTTSMKLNTIGAVTSAATADMSAVFSKTVQGTTVTGALTGTDLTINGTAIVATQDAKLIANQINSTVAGVTATAAAATSGNLGAFTTTAGGTYSLSVGGVSLLTTAAAGVTAANVYTAATTGQGAADLAAAGITVSGADGNNLTFTRTDGTAIAISESWGAGATAGGFATLTDPTAGNTVNTSFASTTFSMTSSGAAIVVGGTAPADAGLTAGTYGSIVLGAGELNVQLGTEAAIGIEGTFTSGQLLADQINSKVAGSFAAFDSSTGKLSITSTSTVTLSGTGAAAAVAADGATSGVGFTSLINLSAGSLQTVNVNNVAGANDAIQRVDAALTSVSTLRSTFGAVQNRFESVIANLSTTAENLSAARSRIQDADFAIETANLSRAQILQQAGTAMVAQANQLPQGVLALLR